jgi:hypothetical protein
VATPFQVLGDPAFLESKEELVGFTLDPIDIVDGNDLVLTDEVGKVLAGQAQTFLVPNS